eukprot:UN16191
MDIIMWVFMTKLRGVKVLGIIVGGLTNQEYQYVTTTNPSIP